MRTPPATAHRQGPSAGGSSVRLSRKRCEGARLGLRQRADAQRALLAAAALDDAQRAGGIDLEGELVGHLPASLGAGARARL